LAAAKEPFRSYVALALNTGLRRGELINLDWTDGVSVQTLLGHSTMSDRDDVEVIDQAKKTTGGLPARAVRSKKRAKTAK